jgi:magnesium-transporting ATPase (P-type)
MAAKKIEEQTTAELQKLAKTYKIIFGVYIGFFILYIAAMLYTVSTGKLNKALVVVMVALITTSLPLNMTRAKISNELKRREEAAG